MRRRARRAPRWRAVAGGLATAAPGALRAAAVALAAASLGALGACSDPPPAPPAPPPCPGYVADQPCPTDWQCPPPGEPYGCGEVIAFCLGGKVLVTRAGPCVDAGASDLGAGDLGASDLGASDLGAGDDAGGP
jgi:hypothetical protein